MPPLPTIFVVASREGGSDPAPAGRSQLYSDNDARDSVIHQEYFIPIFDVATCVY